MPMQVVIRVFEALNERKKCIRESKILVMGVSYKSDIDDTRESPAYDVIRLLHQRGARVFWYDPYVESLHEHADLAVRTDYTAETVSDMDCAIIITGHSQVDYSVLVERCPLIFDSRNVLKGYSGENIVRL
jgi:UDP-N-acetyl-D-glucosamine dehydrogenase